MRWCIALAVLPSIALAHQMEPLEFETCRTPFIVQGPGGGPGKAGAAQIFASGESLPLRQACSRLLLAGSTHDTLWAAEARLHEPGGSVSEWLALDRRMGEGGRYWARLIRNMPAGTRVELRLLGGSAVAPAAPLIRIQLIYAIPSDVPEKVVPPASGRGVERIHHEPGCIDPPVLISRDQWGAVPPAGTQIPHDPYRFALHHTALNRCTTLAQGSAEARFIQDLHINGNGWKDIGYHFLVDDAGRLYAGVPDSIVGTHSANANTGNIGVSMMGLFSTVRPPEIMVAAVRHLYSYLAEKFGVTPDSLYGHRDYTPTECPGDSAYILLVPLRDGIRAAVACGGPYVTDPFPQPFSRNVDVNTQLHFHLRDDQEGINPSSVRIFIDGVQTSPTGVSGNPTHYYVLFTRSLPFPPNHKVEVRIEAVDQAQPPKALNYTYSFITHVPALISETVGADTMSNARVVLTGTWLEQPFKAAVPGVSGTTTLVAFGSADTVSARIYPVIPRSGNYSAAMTLGAIAPGMNFRIRALSSDGRLNEQVAEYNQAFLNVWGTILRGPVYFEAGSPSSGYIELLPASNHPAVVGLDALRFEEKDPLETPTVVDLQYMVRSGSGDLAVGWTPSLDHGVCGYRIYLSPDGRTWGAPSVDETSLKGSDTLWICPLPDPEAPVYVRLSAVKCLGGDTAGGPAALVEGPASDVYGASLRGNSRVLVVDNFDRIASWTSPTHFFVRSYGETITSYGTGFESCANDAIQSGAVRLDDYDAVIYFCGDDSEREESVSTTELLLLMEYLEEGGKLFISGSEIGYDLGRPGRPDADLFTYLFRAEYAGDDAGVLSCEGAPGTLFSGIVFPYGTETSETYTEDWPDFVLPRNQSTAALYYQGTQLVAAVAYTGPMSVTDSGGTQPGTMAPAQDSLAQVVYCAFPVETITGSAARAEIVGRVLEYFGIPSVPLAVPPEGTPRVFSLWQNYPNPFNPITHFQFSVADRERTILKVYDLLGREVATLVDEVKDPGTYMVPWDASGFASGVFVVRLLSGPFAATQKALLLK